jgi:putative restriction endonuclease
VITWATLAFGQPLTPSVLEKLHDPKWTVRAEAVAQLTADSQALQAPATRQALIEPDWENHLLWVDGRIVPVSPTNPEHGCIEATIAVALGNFARAPNLGLVITGDVGIFTRRNPDRVRGADVVFISHAEYERRTKTRGFLDVAPGLVVDPPGRTISAHRPNEVVRLYSELETVSCADALPGFSLPVADVFA